MAEQDWYLVQLKPNSVNIARRNLERQGFDCFCPLETRSVREKGRFVERSKPLFPGYLFVRFDPEVSGWRVINSTSGVSCVVAFGAAPRPVPSGLVDAIADRCSPEGILQGAADLSVGDRVEVTTGPFAGFVAQIASLAPDKRVWVLLDLIGTATRVLIQPESLTKSD